MVYLHTERHNVQIPGQAECTEGKSRTIELCVDERPCANFLGCVWGRWRSERRSITFCDLLACSFLSTMLALGSVLYDIDMELQPVLKKPLLEGM